MPKTKGLQYDETWFLQHEAAWDAQLRPWLEDAFHRDGFLRMLEIGSYEGLSSAWLLENALEILERGLPSHGVALTAMPCINLVCVDAWPGPEYQSMRQKCEHNLAQVCARFQVVSPCHTIYAAPSQEVLPTFASDHFNFIYVDGSHKESDVYADTLEAVRLVRPGGVILWDDYCCLTTPGEEKDAVVAGVNAALRQLGIPQKEVCEDFGHHLRWIKPREDKKA